MQDDAAAELGDVALGELTGVDDVIVEDDVDALGVRVIEQELVEEVAEEQAILSLPVDPGELSSGRMKSASDVMFFVFAGSDDDSLVAAVHPVEADLGVQME